jgi:tetratricopeptide (TPR) repeat protein
MMHKILTLLALGLQFQLLSAQDTTVTRDELRGMASDAFLKSDYTSASVYYKRLLDYYPKDPTYHFYLGACKEESGEELAEAVRLLEFASVRFSPQEVFYYLGAAYQKLGEFDRAIVAYNRYIEKASRKDASQKQVDIRIKECRSGQKPPIKETTVQNLAVSLPTKSDSVKELPVKENIKPVETVKTEKLKPVIFPPKATADESGYMEMLNEALRIQMKSDSLVREAERLRREIAESTDWNQKKKTLAEINILQTEADNLQNNANAIYSKARGLELKFVKASSHPRAISADTSSNRPKKESQGLVEKKERPKQDTRNSEAHTVNTFHEFEILGKSPYSESNPIPLDTEMHSGVYYKIQVGVFSKTVDFQQFRGLSPISGEKIVENGFTRYYAGRFSSIKDTELSLEKVRNYGFREAFIVSFYNGKKISLIRAREIEQMLKTN